MVDFTAILQPLGEYSLYLILLFIVIVIVAVKITKMLFGMLISGVLGGLFPFIVNDFLKIYGLVEPGFQSSLTFALLGVIIYGAYSALVFLYGVAKIAGKAAFLPLRILAFVGDMTIKIVSFVGAVILAPFKFIAKAVSEHKRDEKKDVDKDDDKDIDKDDDDFWKKREEAESEEYDGSDDISVDKTEELVREDVGKEDKDSFLNQVYANYEEFEKDKKKKKD
ncbi:MAG: hypothetical protein KAS11_01320 [Candidatus Aenigmarchaeota archaeon]|nr:hypothetical protein [Candidatus Aenigmarchaeota archaeon]MCK5289584.1 hypothetical protein [Candidatus Aenigmarchaeota archaeon]